MLGSRKELKPMEKIIEVEGLRKSYGSLEAVKGIDFYVEPGRLFAFLGPNGAGKSTTIDMLCTLLRADGGHVLINGLELGKQDDEIRRQIGVVFQSSVLDNLLTVRENLMLRGSLYGLSGAALKSAAQKAAEAAGTLEFVDRPYGKLSGGQRRRADIARALVNTPKILFLDEPTTGLDPKTKETVWQTVRELQQSTGMTVFLTTHYMEEAASADYIVILDHGEIAAKGTPYDLEERFSTDTLRIKPLDGEALRILDSRGVTFEEKSGIIVAALPSSLAALPILAALDGAIESFEVVHGTMEDAFLAITKNSEVEKDA